MLKLLTFELCKKMFKIFRRHNIIKDFQVKDFDQN